ncbi:hypothetical protein [Cypionkella sp.]|uniref:hypothetical protein n=1 Tax=Cypionkella sp. TaxID=2811411 RepID=UPI0026370EBF|nr:hypothetical protein [Cypionkella sp.]
MNGHLSTSKENHKRTIISAYKGCNGFHQSELKVLVTAIGYQLMLREFAPRIARGARRSSRVLILLAVLWGIDVWLLTYVPNLIGGRTVFAYLHLVLMVPLPRCFVGLAAKKMTRRGRPCSHFVPVYNREHAR